MFQSLLLKKKNWENRKGISGILATIFLVLILLFLYSQVYMFMQDENTKYQNAATEMNQISLEKNREEFAVSDLEYTVIDDQVFVEVQIKNISPIPVQLKTFWILDKNSNNHAYIDALNINMNSGDVKYFTGIDTLVASLLDSDSSNVFSSWFVTSRGNLVPLEKQEEVDQTIIAHVALGIGSLAMDFDTFRYYTFETSTKLENFPEGTHNFNVPKNEYMAFGFYLSNFDLKKRPITFDAHSLFWQPGRSAVSEGSWFIVNVDDDGNIQSSFNPYSIDYGERRLIIFASKNDLDIGSFSRLKTGNSVTTVATFLLLHGTKDDVYFAQSIPFVSMFYE